MLEVIRDALRPFALADEAPNTQEQRVLSYFSANPKGTVSGLADMLGCSKRSAERIVANLRKGGALAREGSARGGRWIVVSETQKNHPP